MLIAALVGDRRDGDGPKGERDDRGDEHVSERMLASHVLARSSVARTWSVRLASMSAAILIAFGIVEAGLRIKDPYNGHPGIAKYHPTRGVQLVAGFRGYWRAPVYVNDLGFRDYDRRPPLTREKPPGTTRAIVFGDSFGFGDEFPVEASLPYQLEQLLRASDPSRRWEVINAGVPGYNTITQGIYVREIAVSHGADLVVLVYTLNDADDYRPPPPFTGLRGSLQPIVDLLRTNTYTYYWVRDEIANVRNLASTLRGAQTSRVVDWDERYSSTSRNYQAMRAALLDIDTYLAEQGIPFFVAIYPFAVGVDGRPPPAQLGSTMLRDVYQLADKHDIVAKLVEDETHARWFDALPDTRDLTHRDVFGDKAHPSARTHGIVAKALGSCILAAVREGIRTFARGGRC